MAGWFGRPPLSPFFPMLRGLSNASKDPLPTKRETPATTRAPQRGIMLANAAHDEPAHARTPPVDVVAQ